MTAFTDSSDSESAAWYRADDPSPSTTSTRSPAGFSLERNVSPVVGAMDTRQARQTAELSRRQMVQQADTALAAQAHRLLPQAWGLLYGSSWSASF